jgi:hypothetical protein
MTVTFTLGSLYTGATYVAGPFDIFAVTNTGASTQVGTGITKAELATGHTISGISDATTGGTINSTGTCTNSYPWYVGTPEPTATNTPTGCIIWGESIMSGLQDGCGGFQRTETTLTATLQDGNGNNITATETIYVSFDATYSNELGNTNTTITAQINPGSSSGQAVYSSQTYEIGPYSSTCQPESTTIDNLSPTITGSNGGTYLLCVS